MRNKLIFAVIPSALSLLFTNSFAENTFQLAPAAQIGSSGQSQAVQKPTPYRHTSSLMPVSPVTSQQSSQTDCLGDPGAGMNPKQWCSGDNCLWIGYVDNDPVPITGNYYISGFVHLCNDTWSQPSTYVKVFANSNLSAHGNSSTGKLLITSATKQFSGGGGTYTTVPFSGVVSLTAGNYVYPMIAYVHQAGSNPGTNGDHMMFIDGFFGVYSCPYTDNNGKKQC